VELSDLLGKVVGVLDRLGASYLVTGSMATITYGQPRFTHDIDIAVRLTPAQAEALARSFPNDEYYASEDAARAAATGGGQFNVIHPGSGLKIDFMVALDSEFNTSRFARGRRIEVVPGAAPEDVILRKLEYFREGGSDKHLTDIRAMLDILGDSIDQAYLEMWIDRLDVRREWTRAQE